MKKVCIIFGHSQTKNSFNARVRDVFIEEVTKRNFDVDVINLHEEKEQLPFYVKDHDEVPELVKSYRRRLETSDVMFLIGPCYNLRMPSILENWIDWVLSPPWFFTFRSILPNSRYFKNYGYAVPGAMKGKLGLVAISYGGPMVSYFNFSIFDNIPYRRIKKAIFQLGGLSTKYLRFYSVLPTMSTKEFEKHMQKVREFARAI